MTGSNNNLGVVHQILGDFQKAKKCHKVSLIIYQKKLGPENLEVATIYDNFGLMHNTLGDFEEAKKLALSIYQENSGSENVQVAAGNNNLGVLHQKQDDFEKAKKYHELALTIYREKLGLFDMFLSYVFKTNSKNKLHETDFCLNHFLVFVLFCLIVFFYSKKGFLMAFTLYSRPNFPSSFSNIRNVGCQKII